MNRPLSDKHREGLRDLLQEEVSNVTKRLLNSWQALVALTPSGEEPVHGMEIQVMREAKVLIEDLYGIVSRAALSHEPAPTCQPCKGDVCDAASVDGIICAKGECDWASGARKPPRMQVTGFANGRFVREPVAPSSIAAHGDSPRSDAVAVRWKLEGDKVARWVPYETARQLESELGACSRVLMEHVEKLKALSAIESPLQAFIERLAEPGRPRKMLVSTGAMTVDGITEARSEGRMFVLENGLGFAICPLEVDLGPKLQPDVLEALCKDEQMPGCKAYLDRGLRCSTCPAGDSTDGTGDTHG